MMEKWNTSDATGVNETLQAISLDQRNLILKITSILIMVVTVVAFTTNILNIITFYRMHLYSTINLCFFALSIIDLACEFLYAVIALVMMGMSDLIDFGAEVTDLLYLLGPVVMGFSTLGSWVTAIVSVERCCWLVSGKRIKSFFTRRNTLSLILGMLLFQLISITVNLAQMRLSAVHLDRAGRKQIVLDRSKINSTFFLYIRFWSGAVVTFICFVIIASSTSFLGIKLRQRERWLQNPRCPRNALIRRAKTQVRAVIGVSASYIASHLPGMIFIVLTIFSPALKPLDPHKDNLFLAIGSCIVLCQSLSDVINFFVYLKIISNFKICLRELLFPDSDENQTIDVLLTRLRN